MAPGRAAGEGSGADLARSAVRSGAPVVPSQRPGARGAPNLEILLQQKFLRKKYKDPITGGDFELRAGGRDRVRALRCPACPVRGTCDRAPVIGRRALAVRRRRSAASLDQSAQPGNASAGWRGTSARDIRRNGSSSAFRSQPFGRTAQGQGQEQPGVGGQRGAGSVDRRRAQQEQGDVDRELNGRTRYDQWEFVYVPVQPQPAGAAARRDNTHDSPASARPARAHRAAGTPGSGTTGASAPGHRRTPVARLPEFLHRGVVQRGAAGRREPRVVARRVHAVGQQHHVEIARGIDPERRAGEAGVARPRAATGACRTTRWAAWCPSPPRASCGARCCAS